MVVPGQRLVQAEFGSAGTKIEVDRAPGPDRNSPAMSVLSSSMAAISGRSIVLGGNPGSSSCTTTKAGPTSATSSYRGAGRPARRAIATIGCASGFPMVSTDRCPSGQRTYAAPTSPPGHGPSTANRTPVTSASRSASSSAISRGVGDHAAGCSVASNSFASNSFASYSPESTDAPTVAC
jgi:hypothetical protein